MGHELIIAIETSGRLGSAAIGRGEDLILEIPFSGKMRHGAELFSTIEALLGEAKAPAGDIGQVYITAGPGSFTGLRIAVTAAKMLGFAQKAKIIAADTMDVIAENLSGYTQENKKIPDCICTVLDAKKDFFYAAVFDRVDGQWQKCFGTEIVTSEQLLGWLSENGRHNVGLLGEGLVYYSGKFVSPLTSLLDESCWSATAAGLFRVGRRMAAAGLFVDPLTLTPTYLRPPDALQMRERRKKP
ncbi:MAG: tRNA (adenosine(37)-N6)-threonylcarbamoyltransferase complex dimerization subunit type 1 TsaB [Planctomycetota bacterium]|jgi:tRNA threonylcarbamoyladenosine biosynthesis protein TsaB